MTTLPLSSTISPLPTARSKVVLPLAGGIFNVPAPVTFTPKVVFCAKLKPSCSKVADDGPLMNIEETVVAISMWPIHFAFFAKLTIVPATANSDPITT